MLDRFHADIAAMLDEDAEVAATVVLERLRRQGYRGGITILKEHLARVRPGFLAARSFQRTTYLPGEIGHADWWEPGLADVRPAFVGCFARLGGVPEAVVVDNDTRPGVSDDPGMGFGRYRSNAG